MKEAVWTVITFCIAGIVNAQNGQTDITPRNSWLKLGANAGVPVGKASDYTNFTAGIELKGQLMETPHLGLGLTSGYNHYFGKDGFDGFGTIPAGVFVRVYPQKDGFFAGVDGGYSFVTELANATGGAYVRPQLGYHNYNWNIFGYYNNIFRSDLNGASIGSVGIGATYNIRFR